MKKRTQFTLHISWNIQNLQGQNLNDSIIKKEIELKNIM